MINAPGNVVSISGLTLTRGAAYPHLTEAKAGGGVYYNSRLNLSDCTVAACANPSRPGDNALVTGFIVTAGQPKELQTRGLGPSLPLAGALADPTIQIYEDHGIPFAFNGAGARHRPQLGWRRPLLSRHLRLQCHSCERWQRGKLSAPAVRNPTRRSQAARPLLI